MTDAVAVALDDNACTFVIRDPRNTNYALINNRSLSITQVSEQERRPQPRHSVPSSTPAPPTDRRARNIATRRCAERCAGRAQAVCMTRPR